MKLSKSSNRSKGKLGFPYSKPQVPGTLEVTKFKDPLGTSFDTSWARVYAVRLLRAILIDNVIRPATKVIASPEVHGKDRVEGVSSPVIFASNHASHLDTPLVLSNLPERYRHRCVVAAGADYFFDRRWKAYLWSGILGAIPIERTKVNRRSAELSTQLISEGWSLLIFPEGGRTPDGLGQNFKGGVAQLAIKTGVPVVPIFLEGTYEILGKRSRTLKPGKTRIVFGRPIFPDQRDARELTETIENEIATLALESHSDYWYAQVKKHQDPELTFAPKDRASWIAEWERSAKVPKRKKKPIWPPYFGSSRSIGAN